MRKEDRGNRRATEAEALTSQEISKRKVRLSLTALAAVSESTGSQAQAKSGVLGWKDLLAHIAKALVREPTFQPGTLHLCQKRTRRRLAPGATLRKISTAIQK